MRVLFSRNDLDHHLEECTTCEALKASRDSGASFQALMDAIEFVHSR